jgi:hypothetical protein
MNIKVFFAECNGDYIDIFINFSDSIIFFFKKDAIRNRFKLLRKEHSNETDIFIPEKLIHLTVHDAVIHAFEDSRKNLNGSSVNGALELL